MEKLFFLLILLLTLLIIIPTKRYTKNGFNKKGIHKNGTKYDDYGYDVSGFDKNGYDHQGYDRFGYDRTGFNRDGYNKFGKNIKGQYNRLFDEYFCEDGFYDPRVFSVGISDHAIERMMQRMRVRDEDKCLEIAYDAYRYGKSMRQIKKSSAALIEEIQNKHNNGVLLIYRGYIYIFSQDNTLITVYKNDTIPL